jgi:hypothetical protein
VGWLSRRGSSTRLRGDDAHLKRLPPHGSCPQCCAARMRVCNASLTRLGSMLLVQTPKAGHRMTREEASRSSIQSFSSRHRITSGLPCAPPVICSGSRSPREMGFSKGAVAAVYSSNERFRKMYGPSNVEFAAHIGLYTPCNVTYHDDEKTTGRPIRLFHGIADNWVSIEPCQVYVARLKKSGVDALLTEYPGATHAYDAFMLKEPMQFPQAQTGRHCLLAEGDAGQILNSKTGAPFSLNDPCIEKGTIVAYNEEATKGTTESVKELLTRLRAVTKN